MKEGAYLNLVKWYSLQRQYHRDILIQLEEKEHEDLDALRDQCLQEHGSHVDDGSLFMGFCKRCGASLG